MAADKNGWPEKMAAFSESCGPLSPLHSGAIGPTYAAPAPLRKRWRPKQPDRKAPAPARLTDR
jgi:hypothetical protein